MASGLLSRGAALPGPARHMSVRRGADPHHERRVGHSDRTSRWFYSRTPWRVGSVGAGVTRSVQGRGPRGSGGSPPQQGRGRIQAPTRMVVMGLRARCGDVGGVGGGSGGGGGGPPGGVGGCCGGFGLRQKKSVAQLQLPSPPTPPRGQAAPAGGCGCGGRRRWRRSAVIHSTCGPRPAA